MKLLAKAKDWATRAATGILTKSYGSGSWLLSGSSIPRHYPWNWWQKDMPVGHPSYSEFGPIYACVSIISQDISRIPIRQVRSEQGRKEVVLTGPVARVFRQPNTYQTRSDFMLYLVRSLLVDGNAYALVRRNARQEIDELYPLNPRMVTVYLEPESGAVYYRLSHDATIELAGADPDEGTYVPARDMLHVRGHTPKHPLIGETPLVAAVYAAAAGTGINQHTAAFFNNMSRPSGVLRHPGSLDEDALERIKRRWMELTATHRSGEAIVLAEGMEWSQLQMTAVDAELAKSYQLSERQIFQIYRVPPFLGGDLEKATLSNVESLTRFYLQSCLGFYVDHLEEAFTLLFRLRPNERVEFDLENALLRGDLEQRLNALGKGVQNGIYAPNEARAREGLPSVEYGDDPRVQQQMVPLSFGAGMEAPSSEPAANDSTQQSFEEERSRAYSILKKASAV